MENNEDVLELLEALEDTLDESSMVPLTNKVMVDKQAMFDLITATRLKLPNAINQAKWVVEERNRILNDAKKEAQNIIKEAEIHANKMVSENEIIKKATNKGNRMLDEADRISKEMKIGALEYSDGVLYNLEKSIKDTMDSFHQQFISIEDSCATVMHTVNQNRKELRGMTGGETSEGIQE